ncbi:NADH dehydrogenase subunit E [Fulvimarina pelagi HTCC2506]|uniref:NADH dehydrogenase subunit E n=2 Tax=Fulvimarina pelagi TaxID=217511 RepID=Q0FZ98_9HYPH|nr:NADH-quinone oxidoreductase subunit NuoE [Fulvimarina pelagi]EAU40380.1 NADH dehydrogenase subunit E [Fulvimarina pelagi HTCC2506]BAT31417.1 NADH dehydrogenase subunit E [Fulvimarina pelagi]
MSVRRLADDSIQPQSFAFTDENAAWADATVRKYPEGRQQSAVIPLLMRAQDQEGWVTKAAVEHVADRLKMPLIRVLEVATFYTQFMLQPIGTRAHVQVCGTTPCMLRGAEDLKAVCKKKIHPVPFHRNSSGTLSWEEVECQGACVNAPMVMIFKDAYEDLTPERLEEIIDEFEAGNGANVTTGPQNGRHQSVPIGGLTSLTEDYGDLIAKQKREGAHGPANGAPSQGNGAGRTISTPPSEAGRPDSHSEYTDPSIASEGKAGNGNAPQSAEDIESDELVREAQSGAPGQEGGTESGGTDQAERDAAESGVVTGDDESAVAQMSGGTFLDKEASARDAVVQDFKVVDDAVGTDIERAREGEANSDRLAAEGRPIEGNRTGTQDETAGPVFDDTFETRSETGGESDDAGDLGEGEKPGDLLDAPKDGEKDDLKQIKGIGPVIEGKLNDVGVYHFWQIAAWRREELIWIDNYLNFRGRAVRDRWVDQAKERADYGAGNGNSDG